MGSLDREVSENPFLLYKVKLQYIAILRETS